MSFDVSFGLVSTLEAGSGITLWADRKRARRADQVGCAESIAAALSSVSEQISNDALWNRLDSTCFCFEAIAAVAAMAPKQKFN